MNSYSIKDISKEEPPYFELNKRHYNVHRYRDETDSMRFRNISMKFKSLEENYDLEKRTQLGFGAGGDVISCTSLKGLPEPAEMMKRKKTLSQTLLAYSEDFQKSNGLIGGKKRVFAVKCLREGAKISPRKQTECKNHEINFIYNIKPHNNLIQIIDVFGNTDRSFQYIVVMEEMEASLAELIYDPRYVRHPKRVFNMDSIRHIMEQMLLGLDHIHNSGFIHHDIKSDNILVTKRKRYFKPNTTESLIQPEEYVVKIADFGLTTTTLNLTANKVTCGTITYLAPEKVIKSSQYTTAVDIWSSGCVMLEMYYACLPHLRNKLDGVKSNDTALIMILQYMNRFFGSPYYESNRLIPKCFVSKPFGTWDYLAKTAERKNIKLKYHKGEPLLDLKRENQDAYQIVRMSMQWDPSQRATAKQLLEMPFFQRQKHKKFIIDTDVISTPSSVSWIHGKLQGSKLLKVIKKFLICGGITDNKSINESQSQGQHSTSGDSSEECQLITKQPDHVTMKAYSVRSHTW
ncbi:hypothetical protein WICPIJ_008739 [Wickerhamomyces pijperi]|uniref:Protein kinase domain-containing protein n=1 Tax=Wickerhamomyces pijperi TaxID=599730 RepID=A0A9P8TI23_WICPI|nr:hypothetical protein WICPIJ_008739 [Wickerhamomyces pijperi]